MAEKVKCLMSLSIPHPLKNLLLRMGLKSPHPMTLLEYDFNDLKKKFEERDFECEILHFPDQYWSRDFCRTRTGLPINCACKPSRTTRISFSWNRNGAGSSNRRRRIIRKYYLMRETFELGLAESHFLGTDDKWKLDWTQQTRRHCSCLFFSRSARHIPSLGQVSTRSKAPSTSILRHFPEDGGWGHEADPLG